MIVGADHPAERGMRVRLAIDAGRSGVRLTLIEKRVAKPLSAVLFQQHAFAEVKDAVGSR